MVLPSDATPVVGTVLEPAGISESDPVVGVSSDESAGVDSAGEPTGALVGPGMAAEFAGPLAAAALHWLTGGVCTLQALGSARARV